MSKLTIELCPETGVCSIIKSNGEKVDLMPDEVGEIRDAAGDFEKVRAVVSEADESFAGALTGDELSEVTGKIK